MMYTLIAFFTLSMFIHEGYLLEIRRDATGDVYNNNKCDQGTIIGNRDHTLQCVTNREDTGCDLTVHDVKYMGPVGYVPMNRSGFNHVLVTGSKNAYPFSSSDLCHFGYKPYVGSIVAQDFPYNRFGHVWNLKIGSVAITNSLKYQFGTYGVKLSFNEHWKGQLIKIYINCLNPFNIFRSRCVLIKFEGSATYPLTEAAFERSPSTTPTTTTKTTPPPTPPTTKTTTTVISKPTTPTAKPTTRATTTKTTIRTSETTTSTPVHESTNTVNESAVKIKANDDDIVVAIVGGFLFAFLLLLIAIVSITFLVLRRRKKNKKKKYSSSMDNQSPPIISVFEVKDPKRTTIFNVDVNDPNAFANFYNEKYDKNNEQIPTYGECAVIKLTSEKTNGNGYAVPVCDDYISLKALRESMKKEIPETQENEPVLDIYAIVDKSFKEDK